MMNKPDIISQDTLINACKLVELKANVTLLNSVSSTNSLALSNKKNASLLVAKHQVQGRGRRDNQWASQPGDLVVSYSFMRDHPPPNWFSLNVGISVCACLHRLGGKALLIKWPNDFVYYENNKLNKVGGVLIETAIQKKHFWIVGIGINIATCPGLRQLKITTSIEQTIAHVAKAIENASLSFDKDQFNLLNALKNKHISFIDPKEGRLSGQVHAVDCNGNLGVKISKTLRFFNNIQSIQLHEATH